MNWEEYIEKAKVTESIVEELNISENFLVAALRLNYFSGQLLDCIKKLAFYNNPKKLENNIDNIINNLNLEIKLLQTLINQPRFELYGESANKPKINTRIAHSLIGIITEASELGEALEAGIVNGDFDIINIKEEFFDIDWYKAIGSDEMGISWSEGWQNNIEKLLARYNGSYSDKAAANRDLEKERKILEKTPH